MVIYEHDDSGLGVISKKTEKEKNFRDPYEINKNIYEKERVNL